MDFAYRRYTQFDYYLMFRRALKSDAFGAVEISSILAPFICQQFSILVHP